MTQIDGDGIGNTAPMCGAVGLLMATGIVMLFGYRVRGRRERRRLQLGGSMEPELKQSDPFAPLLGLADSTDEAINSFDINSSPA